MSFKALSADVFAAGSIIEEISDLPLNLAT